MLIVKQAKELREYIEKNFNVRVLLIKCDISDEEEVKNMILEIINKFGRIDVLVNNAGIVFDRSFNEISIE